MYLTQEELATHPKPRKAMFLTVSNTGKVVDITWIFFNGMPYRSLELLPGSYICFLLQNEDAFCLQQGFPNGEVHSL